MGNITIANYRVEIPCQVKYVMAPKGSTHLDKTCQAMIDFIEKNKYDIFTFQEVSADAVRYFEKLKDYDLVSWKEEHSSLLILTRKDRFQLGKEVTVENPEFKNRASIIVPAIDLISKKSLTIFNTHLAMDTVSGEKQIINLHMHIPKNSLVVGAGIINATTHSFRTEILTKNEGYTSGSPSPTDIHHFFAKNGTIKRVEEIGQPIQSAYSPTLAKIDISNIGKPVIPFVNNQPATSFRRELMIQFLQEISLGILNNSLLRFFDQYLTKNAAGLDQLHTTSLPAQFSQVKLKLRADFEKTVSAKQKFKKELPALLDLFTRSFEKAEKGFIWNSPPPPKSNKPSPAVSPPPAPQLPIKKIEEKPRWTLPNFVTAPFRALSRLIQFIYHKLLGK